MQKHTQLIYRYPHHTASCGNRAGFMYCTESVKKKNTAPFPKRGQLDFTEKHLPFSFIFTSAPFGVRLSIMPEVINEEAIKNTAKRLDDKLTRLLRSGLVANIFLFVGGLLYVAFYARELVVDWWTRDIVGDILYLVGFGSLFLSGLMELWIDVGWSRTFGHGRYTTKKRTNLVITVMFLLGNIGEFIAFVFWRQGREGIREEHLTQWVSTHIFLVAAILVLATNRPKYVPFQNRLDSIANLFFFVEAILACCARYVSTVGDTKQNPAEIRLELASAILWAVNAAFYILADMIRLDDPNKIVFS